MLIYKITNKINGKIYIGQTTQSIAERWWQHRRRSPSQTHRSAIHNAIQLHGESSFTIEIIATGASIEELNRLEVEFIARYNSLAPNGYNFLKGGLNKECHPETKALIAAKLRGRPIKNRQNGAKKGRRLTKEWKDKISATMTGVPQPWKYKPVRAIETGVVYESVNAASEATGIERTGLLYLLRTGGRNRGTGLTFEYVDKDTVASPKKAACASSATNKVGHDKTSRKAS